MTGRRGAPTLPEAREDTRPTRRLTFETFVFFVVQHVFSGGVGAVVVAFVGQKKIHRGDWRTLRISLVPAMFACASLPLLCTSPSIASVREPT